MPQEEDPGPTVDLRREEGRPVRKVLLDDLVAERKAPLPAAPVFAVDVVAVEEDVGRRKRVRDGDQPARQNARAAAEARAVAAGLHRRLEQEVLERRKVERDVVELQREVRRLAAAEERLAAAARARLRHSTRGPDPTTSPTPVKDCEHHAAEIASLERAVADQQELVDEYRERARAELRERDAALMEAKRAHAAREQAERHLEVLSDSLKRNALDERSRLDAVESELAAVVAVRDQLADELRDLAAGASRLEQVSAQAETLAARVVDLEAARAEEAARARAAELALSEAKAEAEQLRAERTAVRDEAGVLADTLAAERQAAETLSAHVGELETELTAARAAMHAVGETAASAARDADELHAECDALVARVNATNTEIAEVRAELTRVRADAEEARGELTRAQADAEELRRHLVRSQAESGEVRGELEAALRAGEAADTERDAARTRAEALDEQLGGSQAALEAALARTSALECEDAQLRERLAAVEASAAAAGVAAASSAELLVELARVADVATEPTSLDFASVDEAGADGPGTEVAVPPCGGVVAGPGDADGRRSALAQLTALATDPPDPLRRT